MLRTGLIVEVPSAERAVAHWRKRLDPRATLGVPAHVTVLFPFVAAEHIDDGILSALGELFSAVAPFEFQLVRTGWFERSTVWLAPEPPAPFHHLTRAVTAAFPDYPPYAGEFAEVVPHLTVGDGAAEEQLSAAERDIQHHLPIRDNAVAATLMTERGDGRWCRQARFPLGRRQ